MILAEKPALESRLAGGTFATAFSRPGHRALLLAFPEVSKFAFLCPDNRKSYGFPECHDHQLCGEAVCDEFFDFLADALVENLTVFPLEEDEVVAGFEAFGVDFASPYEVLSH